VATLVVLGLVFFFLNEQQPDAIHRARIQDLALLALSVGEEVG
jgi:hypothetical protein